MFEFLPDLHYPNNGRLNEKFPVFFDVLVSHFHLLLLFSFHGDVDVHAKLFVLVLLE